MRERERETFHAKVSLAYGSHAALTRNDAAATVVVVVIVQSIHGLLLFHFV